MKDNEAKGPVFQSSVAEVAAARERVWLAGLERYRYRLGWYLGNFFKKRNHFYSQFC